MPRLQKLATLAEETGEVANLFNQSADGEPPDMTKLRGELTDLAVAALLWVTAERLEAPPGPSVNLLS